MAEKEEIGMLFECLLQQAKHAFPEPRHSFDVSMEHGVYVIYKGEEVLHVGRTVRGEHGLQQRLRNHVQGKSSFTRAYLSGIGKNLRDKSYSFQFLEVSEPRKRALLKAPAIGKLCPRHIGVGLSK